MATYLRLHAPGPADHAPHPKCTQPDKARYCSYCDTSFKCGDAPHNDSGSLCPRCKDAEGLQMASSRGVIIIDL